MENVVASRPKDFKDIDAVIQWGYKSGQVRDKESARVSMPSQVKLITDSSGIKKYVWRTDLMASKPYWEGWFKGLTHCFLEARVPKQLILAGSDRMDKELTIAQMQGKFKLMVLDKVGHVIQEDQPHKVAEVFMDFLDKFKIPTNYNEQMVITSVSGKKVVISH
jgi:protein phosphatase methylesterase 1